MKKIYLLTIALIVFGNSVLACTYAPEFNFSLDELDSLIGTINDNKLKASAQKKVRRFSVTGIVSPRTVTVDYHSDNNVSNGVFSRVRCIKTDDFWECKETFKRAVSIDFNGSYAFIEDNVDINGALSLIEFLKQAAEKKLKPSENGGLINLWSLRYRLSISKPSENIYEIAHTKFKCDRTVIRVQTENCDKTNYCYTLLSNTNHWTP